MKYWFKSENEWILIDDVRQGYKIIEETTCCNACHRFLSGYDGPRQALCIDCFEDNKDKSFRIRRTFSQ